MVMPRKRHVSRNSNNTVLNLEPKDVMPRKRHVSRNFVELEESLRKSVMPRKRHVSRNRTKNLWLCWAISHASQEACE